MAMLTLRDVVGLAQRANTPVGRTMYDSAVLGNYVLTPEQAANEVDRKKSGVHLKDAGGQQPKGGLIAGKTITHPTNSVESPYSIQGLGATSAGTFTESPQGKWTYAPTQGQIDRDPQYVDKLRGYYKQELGNGIDAVVLPNGEVWNGLGKPVNMSKGR